jgi:hypothetical protein
LSHCSRHQGRRHGASSPWPRPGRGNAPLLFALCLLFSTIAGAALAKSSANPALAPALQLEVGRGYTVAKFCDGKKTAGNPNSFDECLGMHIRGQTDNPYTHYFMLGLEFGCWRIADKIDGKYAALYYFELRSYQKHLGVTDDQLLKALHAHDPKARARLAYWAKHRPVRTVDLR